MSEIYYIQDGTVSIEVISWLEFIIGNEITKSYRRYTIYDKDIWINGEYFENGEELINKCIYHYIPPDEEIIDRNDQYPRTNQFYNDEEMDENVF